MDDALAADRESFSPCDDDLASPAVGKFLVRIICDCGSCREIEPEALARLVGWSMTLKQLASRMRCSKRGKKAAEVVAVARPRPPGVRKNPR